MTCRRVDGECYRRARDLTSDDIVDGSVCKSSREGTRVKYLGAPKLLEEVLDLQYRYGFIILFVAFLGRHSVSS